MLGLKVITSFVLILSSALARSPLCPFDGIKYPSEKCNAYFICTNGQLRETFCQPLNLHYNCEKRTCDNTAHCCGQHPNTTVTTVTNTPSESTTNSTSNNNSTTDKPPNLLCSVDGIKYPSSTPNDCASYFECRKGQLVKETCPFGLTYNCRTQDCEFQITPHSCGFKINL